MKIEYKEIKEFSCEDLEKLFLSVNWESGKYPEKLQRAMKNSSVVVSAWDGERSAPVTEYLNSIGLHAFVLNYRVIPYPPYLG